jgi:hypothetical protein
MGMEVADFASISFRAQWGRFRVERWPIGAPNAGILHVVHCVPASVDSVHMLIRSCNFFASQLSH